jgi:uncharacterized membrane protein YhhN
MNYAFPKPAGYAFAFTAAVYLFLINFISYPLTTLFKPVPILCLIIGILQTAIEGKYKFLIAITLVFSVIGDIVLTVPTPVALELGIGCFLLVHCFYIGLLLRFFKFNKTQFLYYVIILLIVAGIAYFIIPNLGSMLVPIIIYMAVLMLMVFSAFQVKQQTLVIASGALFFLISDLSLALNLFIFPMVNMRIFIMFTYYAAQFFLIWGLVNLFKQK